MPNLRLGRKLGSGHFANVRRGRDPTHGDVAVKVLKRHRTETDADWAERQRAVTSEGRNLSRAHHANVVRVFYVENHPTGPRLVMELCAGGSLQSLYEKGPVRIADVNKFATEASFGLGEVHAKGMLHRDIKPGNILLDDLGRAKLSDFGHVTDRIVVGYASADGYVDHLAIEVLNTGRTSKKSDIWALGMTVYRLLHGKTWYDEQPLPTRFLVAAGGYAKKLKWLPHVPAAWQRFIRKAMNDDPSKRFQSAVDFRNGLAKLPVTPNWDCSVAVDVIRWERPRADKKHVVEYIRKRGHRAWTAKSISPTGESRVLRNSTDVRELRAFLCRAS